MTVLSFDEQGVEVIYEGTEFRLEAELIEEATRKEYPDVTDHEVLQLVERENGHTTVWRLLFISEAL